MTRRKQTPQEIREILNMIRTGQTISPQDDIHYEQRFDFIEDTSANIINLNVVSDSTTHSLTLPLDKVIYNQVGDKLLNHFRRIKSPIRLKNQLKVLLATLTMLEFDDIYSLTSIRSILEVDYNTSLSNNTIIGHLSNLQTGGWVDMQLGYRMGKYGRFTIIEYIDVHDIFKV